MSALNEAARRWGRAAVYTGLAAREPVCARCKGTQLVARPWRDKWTADVCECAKSLKSRGARPTRPGTVPPRVGH